MVEGSHDKSKHQRTKERYWLMKGYTNKYFYWLLQRCGRQIKHRRHGALLRLTGGAIQLLHLLGVGALQELVQVVLGRGLVLIIIIIIIISIITIMTRAENESSQMLN